MRTKLSNLVLLVAAMLVMSFAVASAQGNVNTDDGKNGANGKKNGNEAVVVHPGEVKTVRGVTVDNTGNNKDVTIQPIGATAISVNPDAGAQFIVSGVESGDNVNVINGCGATVNGTGGNVNHSSNSISTVNVSSSSQTNSMQVNGPNSTCILSAGSSGTFHF